MLAHLDGDFDIPNEGVNSDVEWSDDGDFKEPELILPADLFKFNRRGGGGDGGN